MSAVYLPGNTTLPPSRCERGGERWLMSARCCSRTRVHSTFPPAAAAISAVIFSFRCPEIGKRVYFILTRQENYAFRPKLWRLDPHASNAMNNVVMKLWIVINELERFPLSPGTPDSRVTLDSSKNDMDYFLTHVYLCYTFTFRNKSLKNLRAFKCLEGWSEKVCRWGAQLPCWLPRGRQVLHLENIPGESAFFTLYFEFRVHVTRSLKQGYQHLRFT